MAAVIQVKRGSASSWTSANTVLAAGEIGFETDTKKMKVGDGSTAWNSLGYTITDGDITGVTAGTGLSGGGNSGGVTVSLDTTSQYVVPSQSGNSGKYLTTDGTSSSWGTVDLSGKTDKNTLTTTGDIYYASAANTPARLGIGSTGQVLTVNSGLPSWATPSSGGSGLTLVHSSSFSNSLSVQINNVFTSTYRNYRVIFQITGISAQSSNVYFRYSTGGTPLTSGVYSVTTLDGGPTSSPTASSGRNLTNTQYEVLYYDPGYSPNNQMPVHAVMDIFAPAVGLYQKGALFLACSTYATNPINTYLKFGSGWVLSNQSFDGFQLRPQGSDGISGIVRVYGYSD